MASCGSKRIASRTSSERGYAVRATLPETRANYGSVQALEIDWDQRTVYGVADPRRSAGVETAPARNE